MTDGFVAVDGRRNFVVAVLVPKASSNLGFDFVDLDETGGLYP